MNAHNEQQGFTAADMADQAATAFERGRESVLAEQAAAAPGIDLEQFRKLSRDMRKFIDNWDTISIDEFAYFSMRLDEMIDASPKGERVSNSDELAFAARRRRLE